MANLKSQIKRNRQNEKRRIRNKAVRSEMRTRTKNVDEAIASGEGNLPELTQQAIKAIDKAASKGIIHKNQAARRKSRLVAKSTRVSAST